MTRYNSANVKLSNVQLNNLQPGTKNGTGVTLNLSTNVIGDNINETNFRHELLSTDRKFPRFCKPFANNSSANVML